MVQIRAAVPSDSKEFLLFLNKLDSETNFMLFEPGERKTSEEDIKKSIEQTGDQSIMLVAESAGKIIGFLSAYRGHVKRINHSASVVIGILDGFQGLGIGKRLFEELDKWAINSGISRLGLTVMVNNDRAIKLYKKMGFKIEGIKEKSCFVNGVFVDEYYMGKILI